MQKAPVVGEALRRALAPKIRSIDEKARTIEFVASDESVDRYGDVIRVAGWKYQNYLKNPVFLWGHRSGDPPIGKCVNLKVESNPPALVQTIEFADAKTYPFSETVFRLYQGGFMRAVSVGFMPTVPPAPRMNEEGNFAGYEFNGQELLELSAVPIPANQNALARCVKAFPDADLARIFCGEESASASNESAVYKEIASASLDYAEVAVGIAEKVVRETLAKLKAAGVQPNEAELTLDQLLAAVKATPTAPKSEKTTITTLDELAEALPKAEIETLDDLGEIFQQAPKDADESNESFNGAALLRSRPITERRVWKTR